MKPAAWAPNMGQAKQLLVAPGRFGMTGAVYLAAQRRYFMIGWYYPAGGGKMPNAGTHTVWDFYESPLPWGPWTLIQSYDSTPSGLYSPEVCPKFKNGNHIIAMTAGYWNSPPGYHLTVVPLELETRQNWAHSQVRYVDRPQHLKSPAHGSPDSLTGSLPKR
jgi:hypothetical protein